MLIERIGLILDSCYNLTEGELPALKVPSFRPRNNQEGDCFISSLKEEARGDGLPFFLNKDFETVLTYPASPHTPLKDEKGRPYHLILWFWVFNEDKNNYQIINIRDIKTLSEESFNRIIDLISQSLTRGVVVLLERLGIIDKRGKIVNGEKFSKVDRGLEIYGLTGYSCIEDRQVFGLSRGAQSCYPGHINIVYHDYDEYKERFKEGQAQKAKIEDLLKQIGPYDRLILNDFGDLIHLILRKIFWEKDVNITFEEKTSVSSNQKSFYQGFKIKNYQEGFTLKESLTIIATIESFFSNFYTLLKNFYQDFWLGKKDFKDLKNNYIQSLLNDLPNVSKTEAKHFVNIFSRLLDFLINIPPTYGQINYWLNNETLDDQTRAKLERKKRQYENLRKKWFSLREDEAKKNNFLKFVINFFPFYNLETAEMIMEMIFNQVLDPKSDWSNIKFVFPNRFSMSYMIEEYRLVKDGPNFELKVKSITFSPRLSSQKGAFEDVVGIILEREQGV